MSNQRDALQSALKQPETCHDRKVYVAYISSVFPYLTHTFILREILELRRQGVEVEVFSLKTPASGQAGLTKCDGLVEHIHYSPFLLSRKLLLTNARFFSRNPRRYLALIVYLIRHLWRNKGELFRTLGAFPKMVYYAGIVTDSGIRHIHAHWATVPTTAALIIARLVGISYSFTAHAWDIYVDQTMLAEKMRWAWKVVTCTRFGQEFLRQLGGEPSASKIMVSYHGLNPENYVPRSADGLQSDPPCIVSGGRLVKKKGLAYLVEACRRLSEESIAFRCVIVGDGSQSKRLKALVARYGLQERVTFTGSLPHEDFMTLVSRSAVFALPCVMDSDGDMDGIPNVLIESLALGIPVVSTNIGSIPELVEDGVNGILVADRDVEQLACALKDILSNPGLGLWLGKAGRRKVEEQFDIRNNVKELARVFLIATEPS